MSRSTVQASRPVSAFPILGGLQINPITDTFRIEGSAGVIAVFVKRPNGDVQTAKTRAGGRLTEWTNFEPAGMSVSERRRLVRDMRRDGLSQSAIANLLGVSQPTVSLDLKATRTP